MPSVVSGARELCNMRKCGAPRPAKLASISMPSVVFGASGTPSRDSRGAKFATDWICEQCGNANFETRELCNMRNCGAPRSAPREALREGDWTCQKCGNNNYAFRSVCNMKTCGA